MLMGDILSNLFYQIIYRKEYTIVGEIFINGANYIGIYGIYMALTCIKE